MKTKHLLFTGIFILLNLGLFAQAFSVFPNTITGSNIRTCLRMDPLGNKWIGTTGSATSSKGAYKFDGVNWSVYNTATTGIASNIVNDIAFDASNNAWFATRAGVSKFDGSTWTTYNVSNSGLPGDTANCIFIDGSTTWIGTTRGLAKFDGSAWVVYTTASGLVNNYVTALNVDASGNVWIGTQTGLSVKHAAGGWSSYDGNNSNMVSMQVNAIYIESPATAWIGTAGGLFKFENNVFSSVSSLGIGTDMLPTANVKAVSKGPQGGVLFSGSKGVPAVPGFYELVGSQIYFYAFPLGAFASDFHLFEPSSGKVWYIRGSGVSSANCITSFDYSLYTAAVTVQKLPFMEVLDVNQVRAGVLNRGDMHWDLTQSAYEVPKNSGRKTIFASSLWIGGLDAGNSLHQAAMTYRQTGNDYWPGPLDTLTATTDSTTSAAYDKIWKLDRWEIDEFRTMFANGSVTAGTYIPAYNIINWPAQGAGAYTRSMAPFVDVNGDGLYNPMTDGDYPKIKGDQMCYWIFNDNLNVHTETGGQALRVEVHASAYAYACDSIADSLKALNYTTFYDYEIFNRSSFGYHNVYLGLWEDGDLGNYTDDYVGCNPSGNYSFQYNGDNVDESISGLLGYGSHPPMISNVILNGPLAPAADGVDNDNDGTIDEAGEKNLMTNVLNYNNNSNPVNGNPNNAADFYNYMHSKWRTGADVIYGGDGTGPGTPSNFMYDGVPGAAGWSEATLGNPFVDRRILMNCGPFNLNPAQHVNFNFAIVFTQKPDVAYSLSDLFLQNQSDVQKITQWYASDNFPSCDPLVATGITDPAPVDAGMQLYPNPASDMIAVEYKSATGNMMIEIYDVQGQLMKRIRADQQPKQMISISGLSAGLYIVKVSDGKNVHTQRFIKQ
jgi:hypothetical protein